MKCNAAEYLAAFWRRLERGQRVRGRGRKRAAMRYDPYVYLVGLIAAAAFCGQWALLELFMGGLNGQERDRAHPYRLGHHRRQHAAPTAGLKATEQPHTARKCV
jgi:hypothetical protein